MLLLVASMACFSVSDALAKQLTSHLPALEITWFRCLGLLISVMPLWRRERGALKSHRLALQIGRAAGLIGSAVLFILALGRLPIADATAMVFASPLFVTVLSALLLRERVAALRWAVVVTGFAGVLIVMRPGSSTYQSAALLPLGSSIAWALALICTRKVSQTDSVASTMTHSALIGCALLSLLVVPVFVRPTWPEAALLAAMTLAWCSAQWLTVAAYHRAEASTLAPFAYSQLLFSTFLGAVVFGQWPDAIAFFGIALILCCGAVALWESTRRIDAQAAEEEAVR
ncbi:MAG TPA: DMT family transporter [Burkholderiaceae bacterium]